MRHLPRHAGRLAIIAAAAFGVSACGGGSDSADENAAETVDANAMLEQPGNDASALESVVNASEPVVTDTGNQGTDSTDVLGNTSGGDTGGNTVETNATGT